MILGLSPDGMGRGVGVSKAVDPGSDILEHGGPKVGIFAIILETYSLE
jgi:hypothetical protein